MKERFSVNRGCRVGNLNELNKDTYKSQGSYRTLLEVIVKRMKGWELGCREPGIWQRIDDDDIQGNGSELFASKIEHALIIYSPLSQTDSLTNVLDDFTLLGFIWY